jgi:hypothetical protein
MREIGVVQSWPDTYSHNDYDYDCGREDLGKTLRRENDNVVAMQPAWQFNTEMSA